MAACIAEMVSHAQNLVEKIERLLERVGWGLVDDEPYPLQLRFDLEGLPDDENVLAGMKKCVRRFRDGDVSGAMSSICSIVDSITESSYEDQGLGNHKKASYQERVDTVFALQKRDFLDAVENASEPKLIWENRKRSVSLAAYVLGAFRRDFSDVHGEQDASHQLIQVAWDSAVFVVRNLLTGMQS